MPALLGPVDLPLSVQDPCSSQVQLPGWDSDNQLWHLPCCHPHCLPGKAPGSGLSRGCGALWVLGRQPAVSPSVPVRTQAPWTSDVRPRLGPGLGACQGQVAAPGHPGFSCRLALCRIPGAAYSCLCPLQIQRKAVPRLLPPWAWPSSPLALLVSGHTLPAAPGGTEVGAPFVVASVFPPENSLGWVLSPSQSYGLHLHDGSPPCDKANISVPHSALGHIWDQAGWGRGWVSMMELREAPTPQAMWPGSCLPSATAGATTGMRSGHLGAPLPKEGDFPADGLNNLLTEWLSLVISPPEPSWSGGALQLLRPQGQWVEPSPSRGSSSPGLTGLQTLRCHCPLPIWPHLESYGFSSSELEGLECRWAHCSSYRLCQGIHGWHRAVSGLLRRLRG